ncbi:MAG: hypothetical protein IJ507_07710 [Clostridia bacterium]|nr:hypothetical protein [Clostridia bacterium]
MVLEPAYDAVCSIDAAGGEVTPGNENSTAFVKIGKTWSLINMKGEELVSDITTDMTWAKCEDNGLYTVQVSEEWWIIDAVGNPYY